MLNEEEIYKLRDILHNAREEIDNGWTPEVDKLIRDVIWLAEKLKDTNDDCKLKDVEFRIVVGQYITEILDLKKQLEKITKERDGLQQQYTSDVYKNPKNEISDRFYPR